jgi:hypothetical protein
MNNIERALYIDLYTGAVEVIPQEEFQEAILGCTKVESKIATVYRAEEHLIVVIK